MLDEDLKTVWKRAGEVARHLSRGEIEGLLRPTARRSGRALEFLVWTHVVMLALSAALALANLYGYRANPTMLVVEGAIAALSAAGCALSARLVASLRGMDRGDEPLMELIERRIAFTERSYRRWLLVATPGPWLLSLALNTLIDNERGSYRVNHPLEFAVVTAVVLGITYASLRFATGRAVHELRSTLHDLRAEALEATPELQAFRRRSRVALAIGVVLLSVTALLGVLLWLGAL